MKLLHLIKGCLPAEKSVPLQSTLGNLEIDALTCDSRKVTPNSLFIAVDGNVADGHDYIAQAFENKAAAVIAQRIPENLNPDQTARIILVNDSRKATAAIAAEFYGHPSQTMVLVGITGTNGKTTTSWLLESIFKTCQLNTGVIGTVNIRYNNKTIDNPVTTPDAISIQKTLSQMKNSGVTHVVMEVSSHSLDQFRVNHCQFDATIFTNLTQDHLDYHQDMEAYFACKARLFKPATKPGAHTKTPFAVINIDDPYGRCLANDLNSALFRVSHKETGENSTADILAQEINDEITGLCAVLDLNGEKIPMKSSLTGRFNLENILCAAGTALGLGIAPESIVRGISSLGRVPGRLEKLSTPLNRHIFVDYAHTPDALSSILETLSKRAPARLITVFGCGGDRDRTKRAPMGKIACDYSDITIVTSDNPRTESPEAIVEDILQGIRPLDVKPLDPRALLRDKTNGQPGYILEIDRAKALELAVKISRPQDIIVAAGKGHETYQITNAGTIHFDDMEKLSAACNQQLTPMGWTLNDLTTALKTPPKFQPQETRLFFSGIGTDSRTIEPGMVFLALRGDRFDGHAFVENLIKKGISAFVVELGFLDNLDAPARTRIIKSNILLFETDDSLRALGMLARFQRIRSGVKLVAVTGSNGKTTTRKMIQNIFSTQFDTLATQGNFNNEIGMPLTLLRLAPVHEWAVIEMGMNHTGEISRMTRMAMPDIAVITNTSGAHLEGLKTADNVARAKSEIFEGVQDNGTAVIFSDDPRKELMAAHARTNKHIKKICFFGQAKEADICIQNIESTATTLNFMVKGKKGSAHYKVNSPARFMADNAAAAITAAKAAKIDTEKIKAGLWNFSPVQGRMTLGQLSNGTRLINDTYNANPASMAQALTTLNELAGQGQSIAALGDMLELGSESIGHHKRIGHLVAQLSLDRVCLFGKKAEHIMAGALEKGFSQEKLFKGSKKEIALWLAPVLTTKTWLLLKGSRGMAMETLIDDLETIITQEKEAD
ncbi:MAG: UDP-N-acetylmuramoyl-L-alanyl-D-glutamate--2,6-diaminopimelate ligase [Desulfobacter sp.]|nr:UDP-N-acetylmuramoyl-L-alanyl-D-glutamate--2,6-diaminopimelate ligase [Desulfobacter sp.]WDP85489.1 MAG: UDP-N-acetylmuramoyl-L-alanyl-D-glutamate--2,6-diaminopimelate ligase [Desulfobacter sp.]